MSNPMKHTFTPGQRVRIKPGTPCPDGCDGAIFRLYLRDPLYVKAPTHPYRLSVWRNHPDSYSDDDRNFNTYPIEIFEPVPKFEVGDTVRMRTPEPTPMQPTITAGQAYLALSASSGIKIGDKVRVLRAAKHDELGWPNTWTTAMDDAVGNVFDVTRNDFGDGFGLGCRGFRVPFFVLEKYVPPPITIRVDSVTHEVKFTPGCIRVGCTVIANDTVRQIHDRLIA